MTIQLRGAAERPRNDFQSKIVMTVGKLKSGARRGCAFTRFIQSMALGMPCSFAVDTCHHLAVQRRVDGRLIFQQFMLLSRPEIFFPFCSSSFCKTTMFAIKLPQGNFSASGDDDFLIRLLNV